jgi:lipoprotein-anchoring transpeptidase ErfK/SrfK
VHNQQLTAHCGTVKRVMRVSTGSEVSYCENATCGDAITPQGSYYIHTKDEGSWEAPLGTITDGSYFGSRGHAIHTGNVSQPFASHGCVRISADDNAWLFPRIVENETLVVIKGSRYSSG